MMNLSQLTSYSRVRSFTILKCSSDTFRYTDDKKEEVTNSQGYQKVVEVALETLFGEDTDGKDVGNDAKHRKDDVTVAL